MSSERSDGDSSLAESLLHEPVASDDAPERRWAYSTWVMALVSVFVAYHAATLLVHNLPGGGFSRGLHAFFNKYLKASEYYRATGLAQSWGMFAPNPHRTNMFMKVLVEDRDGQIWDLAHDIYGRRRYPYLFYDRMGKINRRIVEARGYQRHYAAWVCREWERDHGGQGPQGVRFVRMWSRVPPPEKVFRFMYYDPMDLYLHEVEEDAFECDTLQHGQIPNQQRERLGFEPRPEEEIRDIVMRTWWDREESRRKAREDRSGPSGDDEASGPAGEDSTGEEATGEGVP